MSLKRLAQGALAAAMLTLPVWADLPNWPGHITLWNKLGSLAEIQKSEVGPDGLWTDGAFMPGVFGNAFVADHELDFTVRFPREVIPQERGCIEFWARLLNPPPQLAADPRPAFFEIVDGGSRYAICLSADGGGGGGGLCGQAGDLYLASSGNSGAWTYEQVFGPGQIEAWHHYALVWDSAGIGGAGGAHKVAVYLDGQLNSQRWADERTNGMPYLMGGELSLLRNLNAQGGAAIDNLVVWDYPKQDFSDRFVETPRGLLLWNRFESRDDVGASNIGPGLTHTSYITGLWEKAQIVPAQFGNGLFVNHGIDEGWVNDGADFFALDLWQIGLTPERGTIEFWFKFKYGCDVSNHARFLLTRNELTGHYAEPAAEGNTNLQLAWAGWDGRKYHGFYMGNQHLFPAGVLAPTPVGSAGPGGTLAFDFDTLQHFAIVWDIDGIEPSHETMRLYVNGNVEAASAEMWNTAEPFQRYLYIGSGPNRDPWDTDYNAVLGVTDNLKIWNYAKLEFADRDVETPCPDHLLGDLNVDGLVNLSDLSRFLSHFGDCVGDASFYAPADLDGRGCVDLTDLALLLANYGTACP